VQIINKLCFILKVKAQSTLLPPSAFRQDKHTGGRTGQDRTDRTGQDKRVYLSGADAKPARHAKLAMMLAVRTLLTTLALLAVTPATPAWLPESDSADALQSPSGLAQQRWGALSLAPQDELDLALRMQRSRWAMARIGRALATEVQSMVRHLVEVGSDFEVAQVKLIFEQARTTPPVRISVDATALPQGDADADRQEHRSDND
jgi:hypothetical protein